MGGGTRVLRGCRGALLCEVGREALVEALDRDGGRGAQRLHEPLRLARLLAALSPHGQRETEAFVEALRAAVDVPVESFDERFTTRLAQMSGDEPEDARAAAHLLSSYLEWSSAGRE